MECGQNGRMRRLALVVLVTLALVACGSDSNASTDQASGSATPGEPAGTKTFTDLARSHVDTPIEYPQTPPVGGNHSPVWQDCQYYDTSVPNERAVHSLEHGAVWITYLPDTSPADRDVLKALAATGDHILVSEYDGLPSPIVATAWGKQLQLQSVNDPELQQFVDLFQSGPQTPEPGVTCRDSTSETT
jgi:Protein of unknown function (DUF3105)